MRFEDLQTFVDIVEAGGMTQAASVKGVSQPGLSRIVRELESRMAVTLLRRTGRGVELTPEGAEFLSYARATLEDHDAIRARLRQLAGAMPERLTVAIPPKLGATVLTELFRHFVRRFPEVTLHGTEETTAEMTDGMNSGRLDCLIGYMGSTPGSGEARPLFRESLYLVGRKGTDFVTSDPVSLAEVARYPLLLNDRHSRYCRMIEAAFQAAGEKLVIKREIETAEGLLAFAAEGEGLSILPYSNIFSEVDRGEVIARRIVNPSIERDIYVHASLHLDQRIAKMATDVIGEALDAVAAQFHWQRR